ncbi:TonB-dependent receptor [Candidatus Parabeggiatoa sp. HSG14]|uniref:TonB-dependent receptor plug domain-containing protein n=1 Tax=Candidatus Parabeggiatoa sp. HSG14 TaxID=3055593 RepID=UPI0025A6EE35|nr:TonB-dependent receptor [Thiotrichales bacterium HSG14]
MKKLIENLKRARFILVSFLILITLSPPASTSEEYDVFSEISLGELMDIEKYMVSIATKTEMTTQEAPSIVSVITGNEIKNRGARNLIDVLKTVPGFNFVKATVVPNYTSNIRGLFAGTNKFKVLINGHGINFYGQAAGILIDKIPVANIKKIEIIRGPGSALYGTNAFFGVISIITKNGGDEPSKLSVEAGSYNSFKPYAELSYQNKDFKAYLIADYYKTDGYDGIIESDMATNSPFFASHAPNKMTSQGKHANLQTNLSYNNLYFSGLLHKTIDYAVPVGIANALSDRNEYQTLYAFGELGYKLPINDKGNVLIKAYHDYSEFEPLYEIFSYETTAMDMHTGFPSGEGIMGSPRTKQSVTGVEITTDYQISSSIQLVTGLSYEYWKQFDIESHANHNVTGYPLEVDGIVYPPFPYQYFPNGMTDISENGNWLKEADKTVMALYGQSTFDLKKMLALNVNNLSLTFGIRHDDYSDFGSSTNPRLGLVYAPTKKLWFKALYGTAFRAPSFGELYARNNPAYVGNENVKPENVTTTEGMIGYNFTKNMTTNLSYFHIQVEDIIEGIDGSWNNMGKLESNGIEAELKIGFDKFKYAYGNFSYQEVNNITHAKITSKGGKIYTQGDFFPGSVPELYGNIGMNYDFFKRQLIANISLNYIGKINRNEKRKWAGENLVLADSREPITAYTLLNASLTFKNLFRGLEIQLSGFNLFDKNYRNPQLSGAIKYDMPRAGRTFMGRISYSF